MIIYPAIDLLDGKCVRLSQGNYSNVTVYSENPAEFSAVWTSKGAEFIHVVDLNGARTGQPVNDKVLMEIVKKAGVPIQVGGGIRSMKRISELLAMGVQRVILGTGAVKNPVFVENAVKEYEDRIVVGIDAKDGFAAIDGWENKSSRKAIEFAQEMESLGVCTIIYTDISRDGMMKGPNLMAMETMVSSVACSVIASGGISSINDILELYKTGVSGVIAGRALYENKFDLSEAISRLNSKMKKVKQTEEICLPKE